MLWIAVNANAKQGSNYYGATWFYSLWISDDFRYKATVTTLIVIYHHLRIEKPTQKSIIFQKRTFAYFWKPYQKPIWKVVIIPQGQRGMQIPEYKEVLDHFFGELSNRGVNLNDIYYQQDGASWLG